MTIEEAIKLLESEYERAKRLDFVTNPIAYALYQVWKKADRRKRMIRNDSRRSNQNDSDRYCRV